jgi:hypothetical protein
MQADVCEQLLRQSGFSRSVLRGMGCLPPLPTPLPNVPDTPTGAAYLRFNDCAASDVSGAWWCTDNESPNYLDFYEASALMFYGEFATTIGEYQAVPNEAFARHVHWACDGPECEVGSPNFFRLFETSEAFGRFGTTGIADAKRLGDAWGGRDAMVERVKRVISDPSYRGARKYETNFPWSWFQTRSLNPDWLRSCIRNRPLGFEVNQVGYRLELRNNQYFAVLTPNQQSSICGGSCYNIPASQGVSAGCTQFQN